MKTTLATLLLSLSLVHPLAALADGSSGSHGGDAIICFNQPIWQSGEQVDPRNGPLKKTKIQLADHWEWLEKSSPKRTLSMGPSKNYLDKVGFVLARLQKSDPIRAEAYQKRFSKFFSVARQVERAGIPEIDDAYYDLETQKNCYRRQFAVRRDKVLPGEATFLIDKELFNDPITTAETRAGLILHEIIFEEGSKLGQEKSDLSRYLNFMISSTFMDAYPLRPLSTPSARFLDFLDPNSMISQLETIEKAAGRTLTLDHSFFPENEYVYQSAGEQYQFENSSKCLGIEKSNSNEIAGINLHFGSAANNYDYLESDNLVLSIDDYNACKVSYSGKMGTFKVWSMVSAFTFEKHPDSFGGILQPGTNEIICQKVKSTIINPNKAGIGFLCTKNLNLFIVSNNIKSPIHVQNESGDFELEVFDNKDYVQSIYFNADGNCSFGCINK